MSSEAIIRKREGYGVDVRVVIATSIKRRMEEHGSVATFPLAAPN